MVGIRVRDVKVYTKRVKSVFDRQITGINKRQAAYVRGVARQSISRKRETSKPGGPVRSPTGVFKNSIFFATDRRSGDAIVGPIRTKHFRVPKALEFGGISKFVRRPRGGGFAQAGYQRVRRRPTMALAVQRAQKRGLLRKAIRQEVSRRR